MPEHELQQWAALAKSITADDRVRHEPPPGLFDAITEQIDLDAALAPETPSTPSTPTVEASAAPPIAPSPIDQAPIDLDVARRRRRPWTDRSMQLLAGAAAATLFLLGFWFLNGDDRSSTAPTFAAAVTNATLEETYDGSAVATVVVDADPMLEIDFDGALPTAEPVELWLIKPDLSDMRSLGLVDPTATSWSGAWPADLDPNEYSLVDLSLEPDDGDPTHSGRSFLRGQLTTS